MNIPAWEKCRLDEIGVFRKGAGISKASVGSGNVACIRYGEIYTDFGPYMKKVYSRISQPIADQSVKLEYGDIVFAGSGETHEEIGKCTAYVLNEPVYAGGDTIIFHPSIKCNSMFLGYLLNTPIVNQQKAQMGQGDAIVHISAKSLGKIELFLPNYEEQTAIATALSDTDALIDSLEKLIAKKQAVKQGTMQELLTGKRRLKGFSGEWKKVNLASVSKIKARIGWQGLTTEEYHAEGYAYLITGTDFNNHRIDWKTCWFVDKSRYYQDANIFVRNGDILITKDGSIGKIAYVERLTRPATLNSGVFLIRPLKDCYNSKYVSYVLSSSIFDEFLEQLSAGSTINHLYQKDFVQFSFDSPSLEEQQAIAQILTDMDDEISALQKKLDKVRRIKQGMMAELLTGRIRLSEPSP